MIRVGDFDRFIFIVGAPRCGTTTLSHFLKDHPAVCFPLVKEPHFFAQNDFRGLSDSELRRRVEEDYLGRFFRDCAGRRIGADASVTYLYTPEHMEPILRLWPESRFIVALRNPLTMLPSLHKRLIYLGVETIDAFEDAWAAAPARLSGREIPDECVEPRWLRYDEAARFATYLERLYGVVGRERCEVMVLDDLAQSPRQQYQRLMDFVGLEPQKDGDFAVHRPGYGVRSQRLQRLLKRPNNRIRQMLANGSGGAAMIRPDDPGVPKFVLALRKRLLHWNRVPASRQPISPATKRAISKHLEDEVARLASLLGRDFSHWLRAEQ